MLSCGQFVTLQCPASPLPRCACLSANGRSLGVLTNDGAVYVLPLLKILTTLPARLFQVRTIIVCVRMRHINVVSILRRSIIPAQHTIMV